MASTVISAILSLTDRMSPKLVSVGKNWDNLSKKERAAATEAMTAINNMQKRVESFISTTLKAGAGLAVAGIGVGFSEAFDLQGYRSQLETATKDTERAAEVMSYAIKLANTTPFEGGTMASAAAALEMASLNTETYLTTLGDTAAGVNREIADIQTQFIKAFATGETGEFFDSINVSRTAFEEFVRTNRLSTASLEDSRTALKAFLDERFGGGMQRLATTVRGSWSTITGLTKSALAQLVGMGTDGEVRAGSILDRLNTKAQEFSAKLVEMQESGKIDEYAERLGSFLERAWNVGENLFTTLWKYRDLIGTLAAIGATVWGINKAMAAYQAVTAAARTVTMLLNGTLMMSPWMLAISGIAALVMGYSSLTSSINSTTASYDSLIDAESNWQKTSQDSFWQKAYKGSLTIDDFNESGLDDGVRPINSGPPQFNPTIDPNYIYSGIEEWFSNIPAFILNTGKMVTDFFTSGFSKMAAHANGTQYHTGGLALVGERGPELVNLPRGSSVTTAERTRSMSGANTFNISVNVTGAEKSDEEIAEVVARKIVEAVDNAW